MKARVGRHANTGVQCQNFVDDQMSVIILLNLTPAADGGAGGSIPVNRVLAGIASDALYNSILRFQKRHFPGRQTGFIEPGDAVLAKLQEFANRGTELPKATSQWGEFKSGSISKALTKALANDGLLHHNNVMDILYATLSNGTLSNDELTDLKTVADKSKTAGERSQKSLNLFVKEAKDRMGSLGAFRLSSLKHILAAEDICSFLKRKGNGVWPAIDRDELGVSLLMRLAYPSLLRQGDANLCGPAAFLFGLLQDNPGVYARFAIDLYEKGTAHIRGLSISPHASVRHNVPPSWKVASADWLTMASLRDSENWFCSFDSVDGTVSGATTQMELAHWLDQARYSHVKEDANLTRHQRDTDNMDEASRLYAAGYRVFLLIDAQMLETTTQSESGSAVLKDRHWITLRSKIDRSSGNVKMTIFTWGEGNRQVPQSGGLPLSDFLENYYGYVAGKP